MFSEHNNLGPILVVLSYNASVYCDLIQPISRWLFSFKDNPNLKEYDNCDPKAAKCQIKPPEDEEQ